MLHPGAPAAVTSAGLWKRTARFMAGGILMEHPETKWDTLLVGALRPRTLSFPHTHADMTPEERDTPRMTIDCPKRAGNEAAAACAVPHVTDAPLARLALH
ncbi:hypothetical protein JZ751_017884 [Albula glossodonta]|uniref:Uncharacterized protein n=1 Tax=Albula glossodonta TaxID=121402 RepID=A0A8T2PPM2_9TELE|nr:hypothetical protein JZ751_017884 [Albula glossodonta]